MQIYYSYKWPLTLFMYESQLGCCWEQRLSTTALVCWRFLSSSLVVRLNALFPQHTGQPWYFASSLQRVNLIKYFMQDLYVFDYPVCPCAYRDLPSWPGRTTWTNSAVDALIHAASLLRSLSPCRSLLCPLASINVMVYQWWSTLSRGRTPLLIWLLLMGENTINKFNYPWPISSGGDTRLLFMSSLKYEYEEI